MKKLSLILVFAMIIAVIPLSLASCSGDKGEGEHTRLTVDVNPSVEFVLDEEGKVMSVTALNDDGSLLIVGEAFVGKTAEEAVELTVSLATELGYLVKSETEVSTNQVSISVSGDTAAAKKLFDDLSDTAERALDTLGVTAAIKQIDAMKIDQLRALALETSLYTEEELAAMDEGDLCRVIAEGRCETALLLTEEMREAYYKLKENEIALAKREETAKIINSMGLLYSTVHASYKAALDLYSDSIEAVEQFRYDSLISPESEYQKALLALRDAKAEMLKTRSLVYSLEVDSEEYISVSAELTLSEENYNRAIAALEQLGEQINVALDKLISAMKKAEEGLIKLEDTLFDENIEQKLQASVTEIDAAINAAKDSFFARFEDEHGDDIAAIENALKAKKADLRAKIEATNGGTGE